MFYVLTFVFIFHHSCRKKCIIFTSILFATIAFSLSCIGTFGCNFVEFVSPTLHTTQMFYEASMSKRLLASTHNQAGIWTYKWWDSSIKQYSCHPYPDTTEIDAKWRASRLLSSLTIILGGTFVLSLPMYSVLNTCYLSPRRKTKQQYPYQFWGTICMIASVCEAFSLIFLRSNGCQKNDIFNLMRNHTCQLSTGAKCTYAAILIWFLSGVFIMIIDSESSSVTREQRGEEDANLEESLLVTSLRQYTE